MTIAICDALIVGSGRATITLSMGTQITIEDALLYHDSSRTLLSFRDIHKNGFPWKHMETIKRNFFSLLNLQGLANKYVKKFLRSKLDCTIHT